MIRFAPNLYFMYREYEPMERFAAARNDGFRQVELCYLDDLNVDDVRLALRDQGQTLLSFNFPPGQVIPNQKRGIAALPGNELAFQQLIDKGLNWASELGVSMGNCPLFGLKPPGISSAECVSALIDNLKSIVPELERANLTLLIEAHCSKDFPGYIIDHIAQCRHIVDAVASPNIRILMDTYHTQRMEGDITNLYLEHQDVIAHIQVGNPPGRNEPDIGEINHKFFFEMLDREGYDGWVVGEYLAKGKTSEGLGWMKRWGVN